MSKVSKLEQNYQERILKTLVYIQNHLNDELSLEKLSAVANFSPFHFHRFFLAYTDEPLQSYVRRLRLERPDVIEGDCLLPDISVRNKTVFYAGKRICLLYDDRWGNKISDVPVSIDYLYVSHGYKGDMQELVSLFEVGTVVIDASLSEYYRERIISDCVRLGIPYLPLSEKGSVHILL
jgi:hypothetical protein